jgi:hypothetical protein
MEERSEGGVGMPEAFTWRRDHYGTREGSSLWEKRIAKSATQGKVTLREDAIRGSESSESAPHDSSRIIRRSFSIGRMAEAQIVFRIRHFCAK